MPFASEVATRQAPTEIFARLGEDTPEGMAKTTEVMVVVSTYKNVINWFVIGQMNLDAQSFRDEIYACAGIAHNKLERGCAGYYRGTNSVHVKRHHADAFEAMYNHNHYPLGGPKGQDFDPSSFPDPVTPEEFRQHLLAFAEADAAMEGHDGKPRFMSIKKANKIADAFEANYKKEQLAIPEPESEDRKYTREDIEELREFASGEQPCKPEKPGVNTRGILASKADERQPPEFQDPTYKYVAESREYGRKLQKKADKLWSQREAKKEQIKKETSDLVDDFADLENELSQVQDKVGKGTAIKIANSAFTGEAVSATIEVGIKNVEQLNKLQNSSEALEVQKHDDALTAKNKQTNNPRL